ncbi:MAG: rod shape-determining protein MreC [Acidobacteriota bacterium]
MIQALLERRAPLLLCVILFILLIALSSQARTEEGAGLLESILFRLVTPVARLAHSATDGAARWIDDYVDLRLTHVENMVFREELSQLQIEQQRWQAQKHEYVRLLKLLDLKERLPFDSVAARVVSRGHALGAHTLVVGRGTRDGLRRNQPIMVPDGIVGRVTEVGEFTAKVQLALNPNSSIAALTERSRAQGLVNGRGRGNLRMEYVSDLADVQPGDRIVTSGLDGIFPAGIVVGTVLRTERGDGLVQSIEVEPAVDFGRLEEILVLVGEVEAGD